MKNDLILPIIAIIGRPNVGKSTLFNRLIGQNKAIVSDVPGVTCDRHYGTMNHHGAQGILIDTGGLEQEDLSDPLMLALHQQAMQAMHEAHVILLVIDGEQGITNEEHHIAKKLRVLNKPVMIVINKCEKEDTFYANQDAYSLGFDHILPVSAAYNRGIHPLCDWIFQHCPPSLGPDSSEDRGIAIAVVGQPNVGKSTMINAWLGEDRVIVADLPGTTKDSIAIPFKRKKQHFTLIDTAGLRRKTKINQGSVEFLAVGRTLQSITAADVVVLVLSATQPLTDQDTKILRFIEDTGCCLVIALNKMDTCQHHEKKQVLEELDYRLKSLDYATIVPSSALHGHNVDECLKQAIKAYQSSKQEVSTHQLTRILDLAQETHQPPMVNHRRIKLRYAHMAGQRPFHIMIHGKQSHALPQHYHRFLTKFYRKALGLIGTPLKISFKTDKNPYQD